jgi:hypothetical protein
MFEALTLIQTGKIYHFPVVLSGAPIGRVSSTGCGDRRSPKARSRAPIST